MRTHPSTKRGFSALNPRVTFQSHEVICSNRAFAGPFTPWPRGSRLPFPPRGFPAPQGPRNFYPPLPIEQLALSHSVSISHSKRGTFRKSGRRSARARFRSRKRSRTSSATKPELNPSDPLNLQDLMNENERRRSEGLSPLRGDSRLNTPALSTAGDMSGSSPLVPISLDTDIRNSPDSMILKQIARQNMPKRQYFSRDSQRYPFRYRHGRKWLPVTGNYGDYYFRRDPNDRLSYLMPEWFSGKSVADYGCHNGTLTFRVLERFPDIRRIDAFDCDAELVANAKSMQRERLRWDTGSGIQYDKINFQVANWIDSSTPTEEPEYDTILAFSVTKWIHLNHGDAGLMRFFRRLFGLLKPGGHLILEPQPKSSYRRTRFTAKQRTMFQTLKIDPVKLEPILVDLGFSYFDTIKAPRPNEPFRRKIMLCSKSYGITPASIRNDSRSEFEMWNMSPSPLPPRESGREPPPVCYNPQTPSYVSSETVVLPSDDSPYTDTQQAYVVSNPSISITSTEGVVSSPSDEHCEPDSTVS